MALQRGDMYLTFTGRFLILKSVEIGGGVSMAACNALATTRARLGFPIVWRSHLASHISTEANPTEAT